MTNRGLLFAVIMLLSMRVVASGNELFSEGELKTLFTTPAERHSLDASRQGQSFSGSDAVLSGPSSVQINGIVTRSNNKSVVWINGKNTMDNTMVDGVKVYPNKIKKNNKIPVRVDGRTVYVKPGETWSESSGVSDSTGK